MTPGGWLFMALGWGFVLALVVFSMGRMLSRKNRSFRK